MAGFCLYREFEKLAMKTLGDQEQTLVEVLKERKSVKNNNESAKSPNFFQDNITFRKKKKKRLDHVRQTG